MQFINPNDLLVESPVGGDVAPTYDSILNFDPDYSMRLIDVLTLKGKSQTQLTLDQDQPVDPHLIHGSVLNQEGLYSYKILSKIHKKKALERNIFEVRVNVLNKNPGASTYLENNWSSFDLDPWTGVGVSEEVLEARDKEVEEAIKFISDHTILEKTVSLVPIFGVTPDEWLPELPPNKPGQLPSPVIVNVEPDIIKFFVETKNTAGGLTATGHHAMVEKMSDMAKKLGKQSNNTGGPIKVKLGAMAKTGTSVTQIPFGSFPAHSAHQAASGQVEKAVHSGLAGANSDNKFHPQSSSGNYQSQPLPNHDQEKYSSKSAKCLDVVVKESKDYTGGVDHGASAMKDAMTWVGDSQYSLIPSQGKSHWKNITETPENTGVDFFLNRKSVTHTNSYWMQITLIGKARKPSGGFKDVIYGMKTFEIDNAAKFKEFVTPTAPPALTGYTLSHGVNVINVIQRDPFATEVQIRRKIKYKSDDSPKWEDVTRIKLTDDMGPESLSDGGPPGSSLFVDNSSTLMDYVEYEAIGLGPYEGQSTEPQRIILLPIENPIDSESGWDWRYKYSCQVNTSIEAENSIQIDVSQIPTEVYAVELRREDMTKKGYYSHSTSEKLKVIPYGDAQLASLGPGGTSVSFNDKQELIPGEFYRYHVFFYDGAPDSVSAGEYTRAIIHANSDPQSIQYFPPMKNMPASAGVSLISAKKNTKYPGSWSVRLDLNSEPTALGTKFVSEVFEKMGVSQAYIDEFKAKKEKFEEVSAFLVTRSEEGGVHDGRKIEFGLFAPGHFEDPDKTVYMRHLGDAGVTMEELVEKYAPKQGVKYTYTAELCLRSPTSLIDNQTELFPAAQGSLLNDQDVSQFGVDFYSAISDKVSGPYEQQLLGITEHTGIFSHLSPSLTGMSNAFDHYNDPIKGSFMAGRTYNTESETVTCGYEEMPYILFNKTKIEIAPSGRITLTWWCGGNPGFLDSFIISAEYMGIEAPIGVTSSFTAGAGAFSFTDQYLSNHIGTIKYKIYIVLTNFSIISPAQDITVKKGEDYPPLESGSAGPEDGGFMTTEEIKEWHEKYNDSQQSGGHHAAD